MILKNMVNDFLKLLNDSEKYGQWFSKIAQWFWNDTCAFSNFSIFVAKIAVYTEGVPFVFLNKDSRMEKMFKDFRRLDNA